MSFVDQEYQLILKGLPKSADSKINLSILKSQKEKAMEIAENIVNSFFDLEILEAKLDSVFSFKMKITDYPKSVTTIEKLDDYMKEFFNHTDILDVGRTFAGNNHKLYFELVSVERI